MEPRSHTLSTNTSIPALDDWRVDSDAAAHSAAHESPSFARPMARGQEYVVYALYRPSPNHPATWFLTRVESPPSEGGTFVARVSVVDASTRLPATSHAGPQPV